jgi:hypothetical protein
VFRTFTGSTLATVLITLIAVKHLALGFCLCNEELFITECPCSCFAEPAEPPCCCEEETPEECPAEAPCDECIVAISLDTGDFLWSADAFDPAQQTGTPVATPETLFLSTLHTSNFAAICAPIRGSPPSGPPLFLRTTVLRL